MLCVRVHKAHSVRCCGLCVSVQGTMSSVWVQAVSPGVPGGGDVLGVCVQGAV